MSYANLKGGNNMKNYKIQKVNTNIKINKILNLN